ncbi:MAG TPA: winged helix DNA-binding domain-containing protein [Gaiellaceae bacterium]|nr:winged helix DNA-binding domain-containing protein [Gaiellaceae bacterium]
MLERAELRAVDAVRAVAGLQAQDSAGPYLGLRARLRDFRRAELTAAVEARGVLVATLQRVTLHMVDAADYRWLKPTLRPLHEQTRRRPGIAELDHEAVLAQARRLLPARMPELRALVPDVNPGHVSDFLQSNLPLVRVPPAGTWGVGGSPLQELAEVGEADDERLVLTYLSAFGPATPKDAQAWSGLTNLAAAFARLDLVQLEGDDGTIYYDVPGAPLPPAGTEAPVRFLPRFDNVLLAHADRRRVIPEGRPTMGVVGNNTVLVDGMVAGTWRATGGEVEVMPYSCFPPEVKAERRRLRNWLSDG